MQEYGDKEMDKKNAKTITHIVVLIDIVIVLSKPPAHTALPNATPPTGKIHPSVKWP